MYRTLYYRHKPFQAVHLQDLSHDCTIRIAAALPGTPIHMTHCHTTHLYLHTQNIQQVRIHTSTQCDFYFLPSQHTTTTTSIIFEGSRQMTLHCSSPQNLEWKDFDWLRSHPPSPNVAIVPYHHDPESNSSNNMMEKEDNDNQEEESEDEL
jgi:hypothetical protein